MITIDEMDISEILNYYIEPYNPDLEDKIMAEIYKKAIKEDWYKWLKINILVLIEI